LFAILYISMSTSFTDRATKISTLNIERSWHSRLYQGIGQNTYRNLILWQSQSSVKAKRKQILCLQSQSKLF